MTDGGKGGGLREYQRKEGGERHRWRHVTSRAQLLLYRPSTPRQRILQPVTLTVLCDKTPASPPEIAIELHSASIVQVFRTILKEGIEWHSHDFIQVAYSCSAKASLRQV